MAELRSTFGEELRRRRRRQGLSLNGLARVAFYSKGHLSKIENGLATPQLEQAWQLDSILKAGGELARLLPDTRRPAHSAPPSGLPNRARHFIGREREFVTLVARLSALPLHPGDAL